MEKTVFFKTHYMLKNLNVNDILYISKNAKKVEFQ